VISIIKYGMCIEIGNKERAISIILSIDSFSIHSHKNKRK